MTPFLLKNRTGCNNSRFKPLTKKKDESLNLLYDAIRQLSKIDRGVILRYLEEKPYKEIADMDKLRSILSVTQ